MKDPINIATTTTKNTVFHRLTDQKETEPSMGSFGVFWGEHREISLSTSGRPTDSHHSGRGRVVGGAFFSGPKTLQNPPVLVLRVQSFAFTRGERTVG